MTRPLGAVYNNGTGKTWFGDDERRGRPEKRFEDGAGSTNNGKEREFEEIDELDEDADGGDGSGLMDENGSAGAAVGRHMVGVETGLNELRVGDQQHPWSPRSGASVVSKLTQGDSSSSRSRSSGHRGEEQQRGRSRGAAGPGSGVGRSGSTSRARAIASSSSADRRSASSSSTGGGAGRHSLAAEAEITRLKSKVSELTFLNGLLMSRLRTLEGPGRVPVERMTSLTAETPRPDFDEYDSADGAANGEEPDEEELELQRFTRDPETRQSLLQFLKAQAANGTLPPPPPASLSAARHSQHHQHRDSDQMQAEQSGR